MEPLLMLRFFEGNWEPDSKSPIYVVKMKLIWVFGISNFPGHREELT